MAGTRDRIIKTALNLFNRKGTAAVTTNHIAAAMGISPGNLYYHFRNKQEIIRAVYEVMDRYGLEEWTRLSRKHEPNSLEAMEGTFRFIQEFNWKFRFFKRELSSLIQADPVLKELFQKSHATLLGITRESVDTAVRSGVLKPLDEAERATLAEMIWMFTLFWLNYLEVSEPVVTRARIDSGVEILRFLLTSFMSAEALRDMRTCGGQ